MLKTQMPHFKGKSHKGYLVAKTYGKMWIILTEDNEKCVEQNFFRMRDAKKYIDEMLLINEKTNAYEIAVI